MPSTNSTRGDVEERRERPSAAAAERSRDEMVDRLRLDDILSRYGAETVVQWIGELARDRRPRS